EHQLQTDEQRLEPADAEERQRREEVQLPDALVIDGREPGPQRGVFLVLDVRVDVGGDGGHGVLLQFWAAEVAAAFWRGKLDFCASRYSTIAATFSGGSSSGCSTPS